MPYSPSPHHPTTLSHNLSSGAKQEVPGGRYPLPTPPPPAQPSHLAGGTPAEVRYIRVRYNKQYWLDGVSSAGSAMKGSHHGWRLRA